jgi:hypothetical protein
MQDASAAAIRFGLGLTDWTISDLWIAAAGIGGSLSRRDVDDIASGRRAATPIQHDILATALNEHLLDQSGGRPIHYWRQLQPPTRD